MCCVGVVASGENAELSLFPDLTVMKKMKIVQIIVLTVYYLPNSKWPSWMNYSIHYILALGCAYHNTQTKFKQRLNSPFIVDKVYCFEDSLHDTVGNVIEMCVRQHDTSIRFRRSPVKQFDIDWNSDTSLIWMNNSMICNRGLGECIKSATIWNYKCNIST